MENRIALTGIGIGALALAFFLVGIGKPPMLFFDEPLYVDGARSILNGAQDLNPEHPPLAKFFIAGAIRAAGDTPFGWRLAGAMFGALTLVAIFFWTYLLLSDYSLALTAAGLTFFNNFLFVMARVAMLDVFYFAFVIWGILAFTAALMLEMNVAWRRSLLVVSGLLFGLGTACKWNAVVTLAAVALVAAILYIRNTHHMRETGATTLAIAFSFVPVAAYLLAYWPLCLRFHRPFSITELIEMNAFIWRYHVSCPGNPALDVHWYRWFFRSTPERGLSYLMGNFVVVWGGVVMLALCAWRFLRSLALPEGLVTLFYSVNLLQWVLIPQKRLVYYYYFAPAMFLGVAIAIVLCRMERPRLFGIRLSLLILLAAGVFFLYCYPRMAALQSPYDCMFGCWS
jgi:dolichyl-phosphate-mannose-protein mannosyltransferase